MKMIFGATAAVEFFLLTGCSVGLETGAVTSEAEELEAGAEVL